MKTLTVSFGIFLSIFFYLTSVDLILSPDGTDNPGWVTILSPEWITAKMMEKRKLQWVIVSGSFSNYTISKVGSTLEPDAYHWYDSSKRVITLCFFYIQSSDGGFYSLAVTPDPLQQTFVSGLFVYDSTSAMAPMTGGRNFTPLGSTIEIDCSVTSTSHPATRRPKLYYFWSHYLYGDFQNISSGPVILRNGEPLPRYSIKNDGQTLVIASVQGPDSQLISCSAQEYGSPYGPRFNDLMSSLYINMVYPPYIVQVDTGWKKINVDLSSSKSIIWKFSYISNPSVTSYSNWMLVNRTGYNRSFLFDSSALIYGYGFLNVTLPNKEYYGNYSLNISNTAGSTTITVQVVELGTPDTPIDLAVRYITHSAICLKWKCQASNDGLNQTVFVMLRDVVGNIQIETHRKLLSSDYCSGSISQTVFQRTIQPETEYEATIWSTNSLGSSGISKLNFKTPTRINLTVTPETIAIVVRSIIQSDALINVTSTYPEMAWLNVSCCAEDTCECSVKSYNVFYSLNQIVFENVPDGEKYVFDFILFNGDFFNYVYVLSMVKGIRVGHTSRNDTEFTECDLSNAQSTDKGRPLFVATIVLAVLLGVAASGLIGCLVAYLIYKSRSSTQPLRREQPTTGHSTQQETPIDAEPYSAYESIHAAGECDHDYTTLQRTGS